MGRGSYSARVGRRCRAHSVARLAAERGRETIALLPRPVPRAAGTPLTNLSPGAHADGLWITSAYRDLGYSEALGEIWIHELVLARLEDAVRAAGRRDHGILVWDAWRPLSLQRKLYRAYRAQLEESSGLSGPELDELVAKFVTEPDRVSAPPAHATGGAVDVTLCDPATGSAHDLGGDFDELTDRSLPAYYDDRRDELSMRYASLRADLDVAMGTAGFVRLETEWWHFEYGTQYWSGATGERVLLDTPISPHS
jgi:zinc D-Ala-D-Ala dipeptidase